MSGMQQPQEGAWEAVLRNSGASEDVINQVRQGFQADLTRSRQKDTGSIRELTEKVNWLTQHMQAPQQQAAPAKPRYVQAIEDAGVDPKAVPELHKALSAASQAAVDEAVSRVVQQLAPHLNQSYVTQQQQALQSERERMRSEYGEDIDKFWPQMEQEAKERLSRGNGIRRMEDVLEDLNKDALRDLQYKAEHKRRIEQGKRAAQSSYEGMASVTREQAVPTERTDKAQDHAIKPMHSYDDIQRITREALSQAGIGS